MPTKLPRKATNCSHGLRGCPILSLRLSRNILLAYFVSRAANHAQLKSAPRRELGFLKNTDSPNFWLGRLVCTAGWWSNKGVGKKELRRYKKAWRCLAQQGLGCGGRIFCACWQMRPQGRAASITV